MITKVTKDNKGLYESLFAAASKELGLSDDDAIVSLDEFFGRFSDLASVKNKLYVTLPLDEPTFDIDANTRVITIPDEFKKNGLSVQGDQGAETIFFTVDRFFDTVDLYSTIPVIEYEITVNKSTVKGISPVTFKDIELFADQNKMLFGWFLNNTITQSSGSIKFAVRFYKTGLDKDNKTTLAFSLSTLSATAVINPGLNFDFDQDNTLGFIADVYTDDTDLIKQRYAWQNETVTPATTPAPTFIENIYGASDTNCVEHITEDGDTIHVFDLDESDNTKHTFTVAANVENGTVKYFWQTKAANGGEWTALDSDLDTPVYVSLATGTVLDGSVAYYTAGSEGVFEPYTSYTSGDTVTSSKKIYVLKHQLTVSDIADYRVIVKNTRGTIPGQTTSAIARIPGPAAVQLGENTTEVILDTDSKATLEANATVGNEHDKLTYAWSKNDVALENENAANLSIDDSDLDDAAKAKLDDSYTVEIKATRNNAETDAQVITYRVTDVPHVFENVTIDKVVNTDGTAKLTLNFGDNLTNIVCDSLDYQWMRIKRETAEEFTENDRTNDDYVEPVNKDEFINISKADLGTGIKLNTEVGYTYYCKLINHVNGQASEVFYTEDCSVVL